MRYPLVLDHDMRHDSVFKLLFESSPHPYLILRPDAKFTIAAVNDRYLSATGTQREAIVGHGLFEIFPDNPDDKSVSGVGDLHMSLDRVVADRKLDTMGVQKYDIPRRDGSTGFEVKYWSPVNTPVFSDDGSVAYIIHHVEDVTEYILGRERANREKAEQLGKIEAHAERMEAEVMRRASEVKDANRALKTAMQELEQREAELAHLNERLTELDRLKSQFFANVSHELRTPLTLILAPLEQRLNHLTGSGFSEAERRETELMLRNARLLYRHVSDLLDAAKLEAGRMTMAWVQLDLASLVRTMSSHFESLTTERHIDFTVIVPDTLPAEADGEKLQRVMLNLLSNAFKFTPDGGHIAVRLSKQEGHAIIEVEDSGPGVPAELREAVFERFRQVEGNAQRGHGGSGLGLAIVKDFVELHGGTVKLGEAPGGSALFSVRLPLIAPDGTTIGSEFPLDEKVDRQAVEELQVRMPAPRTSEIQIINSDVPLVLVVEDNLDMNEFIATALRPYYRVISAFNGREGMDKALALHPDLILTDVMMPVMSGDEMVFELRQLASMENVPIVILTAKADDDLRLRLLEKGVQSYLNKPFSIEELLVRVGGLVASRRRTLNELSRSAERLRRLAEVVEKIAAVHDLQSLMAIVRRAVRELTGADGATLVLRDNGQCHYVEEDAIGPLWKGQRFPLESCISGWTMLHAEATVIEDIYVDPRIPYAAYRPTFVKSLSMVPIGRENPVGAIGCYWAKQHKASAEELELQQALADAMSVGLANLELYEKMEAARKSSEQAARKAQASEAALQVAQRMAGLGNWEWDIRTGMHSWSEEIYHIYGRDPDLPPAVFPEVQQYFTPDSWARLATAVENALAEGLPYECDAEVVRPDGTHRWVVARGEVSRDAGGNVINMHGTIQDITQRKLAEDEINQLNAELEQRVAERTAKLAAVNRAKDSFLATMSHEIRTPLTGMLGMLELLSLTQLNSEQQATLDAAWDSGRGLLRIVSDILDWSKIEEGKLELSPRPTSIEQLLQEVVNTYSRVASAKSLILSQHTDARISTAHNVDPLRLSQVLNNFVSNSIKFTQRGEVEVSAELIDQRNGAERIRFSVKDTGIGIAKDIQERLFQRYQQESADTARMYGGTGLGLSICRRLAEMMDGTIELKSEQDLGSIFSIVLTLPVTHTPVEAMRNLHPDVKQRAVKPLLANCQDVPVVLAVDDHPTNRNLLARQIKLLGLQAETAENGEVALSMWRDGRFALVITDCHMPEMDGYALSRAIRHVEAEEARPRTPIIAWTANALAEESGRCQAADIDDLLVKPTDITQLRNMLAKWLSIPETDSSQAAHSRPDVDNGQITCPIDYSVLSMVVADKAEQLQVLQDFHSHIYTDCAMLQEALKQDDGAKVSGTAHRMKGSCRMVGATCLANACENIERVARNGDMDRAKILKTALDKAISQLEAHFIEVGVLERNHENI